MSRESVNKFYYSKFKGVKEHDLIDIALKWSDGVFSNEKIFNQDVLNKFYELKKQGFKTVLVSGSYSYCLMALKNKLGADYLLATELETDDDVCTGEILGDPRIGPGKETVIKKLIKEENLSIDFKKSYAFGDHESDYPMLSMVGNAFLVINGNLFKLENKAV